jgi:hypothetical protein
VISEEVVLSSVAAESTARSDGPIVSIIVLHCVRSAHLQQGSADELVLARAGGGQS